MKYVLKNKNRLKVIMCFFIALLSVSVSAVYGQSSSERTKLSGTVLDENGEALVGVSVVVKGTTIGMITDINGKFTLNVPSNAKELLFSYVGYESQTVAIGKQTQLNIRHYFD